MQLFRVTIVAWVVSISARTHASWDDPGHGQYHIQTDEGPERYFRFQTDNGQFRKEKRLQDGTVIGTEAWIDAAGFLRQKDYIADTKGYRILKSKTVFVGQGRSVDEAMKSTKSIPPQSGVLVDGSRGLNQNTVDYNDPSKSTGYVYSTTMTPMPFATRHTPLSAQDDDPTKLNYLSPINSAKIQPSPYLGFDHYPDELLPPKLPSHRNTHVYTQPTPRRLLEPTIQTHPLSLPIEQAVNNVVDYGYDLRSNSVAQFQKPEPPSFEMEPPFKTRARVERLRPVAVVASAPAPIVAEEAEEHQGPSYSLTKPTPFTAAPTFRPPPRINGQTGYSYAFYANDNSQDTSWGVNSLDAGGLLPPPVRPQVRHRYAQRVPNDHELFNEYDGVSATRDGFRYVLPHQYHEEAEIDDKRAGSFGYVDPFGIRRVVYYNASPSRGFMHRNNNRFVGLDAVPYDPVGPRTNPNSAK